MKKKQKLLVALMALTLAGGVTSALALNRQGATGTATSGSFDKAIYLYWSSESTSSTLSDIDSMPINQDVWRYLTVAPKSTKTLTGIVDVTFTLASQENTHINGLSISVYTIGSAGNDSSVASLVDGVTPDVIDANNLTATKHITVSVSSNSSVHESTAYYALKVRYDGSIGMNSSSSILPLGGLLTISQSFHE